jgi:uncharacterized membrane protein (UPF0127 family)
LRVLRVTNVRTGAEVASWVGFADRWWRRAVGLLGRSSLDHDEGLLLAPCASVHTVGMRFAIDVAFLDQDGRVVTASPGLFPGGWARGGPHASATLELPPGRLAATDTRPGDMLVFERALA